MYALHAAITENCITIVKLLVEAGDNVEACDHIGRSSLFLATQYQRQDIVNYLSNHVDLKPTELKDNQA